VAESKLPKGLYRSDGYDQTVSVTNAGKEGAGAMREVAVIWVKVDNIPHR